MTPRLLDPEISAGSARRPFPWGLAILACAIVLGGCFPREPGEKLAYFEELAPAVGEPAPPLQLTGLGGEELDMEDLLDGRPLVLQLGSHSCPVYRFRRHWMHDLQEDYRGRVDFLLIYTQEAHPVGSDSPFVEREWNPWINKVAGVRVEQTETLEDRLERARESRARLDLELPMAVDAPDNSAWQAYGAAASPAFILDAQGTVAAAQVWIDPKEIRLVLDRLLATSAVGEGP